MTLTFLKQCYKIKFPMAESVRETGGRSSSHQIDNRRVDFTIAPSSRPEVINQDHLDQAKGP